MEKEKIAKFIQLLDGVSKKEWDVIKRNCDQLYEMASINNVPPINEKVIEYFTNQVESTLKIFDDIKHQSEEVFR